jgi:hypothetical protein
VVGVILGDIIMDKDVKKRVTEFDLRMPEFKDYNLDLDDLEFRADGKVVRKDRWETGFRRVTYLLGYNGRNEWEIDDIIEELKEKLNEYSLLKDGL